MVLIVAVPRWRLGRWLLSGCHDRRPRVMASKFACSMALISGTYLPSKCGLWVASICVASMWLVRLRRLAGLPVHWRPCLASRWPPSMALTRLLTLWFPCVFFLSGSWATTLIYACSATSMFGVSDASFMWVHLIFVDIYRYLCLCASFLVRIAGGGAAPSPLHPPTRFSF